MKLLDSNGSTYYFAPRKRRENLSEAFDKISTTIGGDFSYVTITGLKDERINWHTEAIDFIRDKINFKTHNLIIVTKL